MKIYTHQSEKNTKNCNGQWKVIEAKTFKGAIRAYHGERRLEEYRQ